MKKGCIYYTDNRLNPKMLEICQRQLRSSFDGEIVNVSLKPMKFGDKNIVLEGMNRSYPTMITQILTALKNSTADLVYFTEHDVLYHKTHFDLELLNRDLFYYNQNNFRWRYPTNIAVTYGALISLSGMCCYREHGIQHYEYRIKVMKEQGLDKNRGREPRWARRFGYEPGTKPIRRGGLTDEKHLKWRSDYPNVDIRHGRTFSHPKTRLEEFRHKPQDFVEIDIGRIPGWNLKYMFKGII